jgi:hypothetical protein
MSAADPGAAAVLDTSLDAKKEKMFEEKGARYARWAQYFLVAAIFLIFIGVYFQTKNAPQRMWLMSFWIVGLVLFFIFIFLVFQQNKIIECMKDMSGEGCMARIGQECGGPM